MTVEYSVWQPPSKGKHLTSHRASRFSLKNNLRKVFIRRCLYKNSENILLKTYLGKNVPNSPIFNINTRFSPLV